MYVDKNSEECNVVGSLNIIDLMNSSLSLQLRINFSTQSSIHLGSLDLNEVDLLVEGDVQVDLDPEKVYLAIREGARSQEWIHIDKVDERLINA